MDDKIILPTPNEDVSIVADEIKYHDRDSKGRFVKGNGVRKYQNGDYHKLHELRLLWWDCCTLEKMQKVYDELYEIAFDKSNDAKLRASVLLNIMDRAIGKPSEHVNLTVEANGNQRPIDFNLSDEELSLLERLVRKTRPIAVEVTRVEGS